MMHIVKKTERAVVAAVHPQGADGEADLAELRELVATAGAEIVAEVTQDRSRIRRNIRHLQEELDEVRQRRAIQRGARERMQFATAALVGYTSAGKSTLLNALSGSEVFVDPKLFATLDPTTRRIELPNGRPLLLTDTVGFIRKLPTHLVAAFRATLEETVEADVLLHVVDASHPRMREQIEAVFTVLEDLGV